MPSTVGSACPAEQPVFGHGHTVSHPVPRNDYFSGNRSRPVEAIGATARGRPRDPKRGYHRTVAASRTWIPVLPAAEPAVGDARGPCKRASFWDTSLDRLVRRAGPAGRSSNRWHPEMGNRRGGVDLPKMERSFVRMTEPMGERPRACACAVEAGRSASPDHGVRRGRKDVALQSASAGDRGREAELARPSGLVMKNAPLRLATRGGTPTWRDLPRPRLRSEPPCVHGRQLGRRSRASCRSCGSGGAGGSGL